MLLFFRKIQSSFVFLQHRVLFLSASNDTQQHTEISIAKLLPIAKDTGASAGGSPIPKHPPRPETASGLKLKVEGTACEPAAGTKSAHVVESLSVLVPLDRRVFAPPWPVPIEQAERGHSLPRRVDPPER